MSFFQTKSHLINAALSTAAIFLYIGHFLWTRRQPRVLNLVIYPIKSLPGINVDELEVTNIGVKYGPFMDRSYIILNENNLLISQRLKPKMALIRTSLFGSKIVLSAENKETLFVDVNDDLSNNERVEFKLWNQPTSGVLCDEKINNWLSDVIGLRVKLIKFIDEFNSFRASSVEIKDDQVIKIELNSAFPIRYQDGDPILLTNSSSITDLNTRISDDTRITYKYFRPNIHVQLKTAYEEDETDQFTIGDVTFENIKRCDRCTFTTVNPETGVKHPDSEPLKTLRIYRLIDGFTSPLFGINLRPLQQGIVKLDDYVISINLSK